MKLFKNIRYQTLYSLWALLFVLTAALGLLFPNVEGAFPLALLRLAAVGFFVPPCLILLRARAEGAGKHIRLLRYLSLCSVGATCVLLGLNIASVGMGPGVGLALNAALAVISAPLVCGNLYVLPLFLWGCLLMATFSRR